MVGLDALWLPIVLAAVVVWIAASIMWMVLPHHRTDWVGLPHEDRVADALRGTPPGQYNIPHAPNRAAMKSEAWLEKVKRGPMAMLIVSRPGPPAMGKSLTFHFVYCLVISLMVAYLTGRTLGPGAEYLAVFRVAGTAAILGYSGALPPLAIWFGRTWTSVGKEILDGVVYGLLTASIFGCLWPA